MPAPRVYRKTPQGPIQSYTFTEIGQGKGILTFYGATKNNSSAYILTNQQIYSNDLSTYVAAVPGGTTKVIDVTFSTPINFPLVLQGELIANIPVIQKGVTGTTRPIVTLKKSGSFVASAAGVINYFTSPSTYTKPSMHAIAVTIPQTTYVADDTLDIAIEIQASGTNSSVRLGHDPKNRGTAFTAAAEACPEGDVVGVGVMSVQLPVKLDI